MKDKFKKISFYLGWVFFFSTSLVFFTVLKIREEKLKNWIDTQVSAQLAQKGYQYSAKKTGLKFGLGISFVVESIQLTERESGNVLRIDSVEVTPKLLALFSGNINSTLAVRFPKGGDISGDIGFKNPNMKIALTFRSVELGKDSELLAMFLGVRAAKGTLEGPIDITADPLNLASMTGQIDLKIKGLDLTAQKIQGFPTPAIKVGDGVIKIGIAQSKATIQTLELGKRELQGNDLYAQVQGDVLITRRFESSALTLKAVLGISSATQDALSLLMQLLAPAKTAEGLFQYQITGPLEMPNSVPSP